jgi:hypothetical protein
MHRLKSHALRVRQTGNMATILTYQMQQGFLTGTVSGRELRLRVHRDSFRIAAWQKWAAAEREKVISDSVSVGAVSHKLKVYDGGLEIYDYPGSDAKRATIAGYQRRRRPENHSHAGPMIFVREPDGGFYIHGYPPCNIRRCIILADGWNEFFKALAREAKVEMHIE